MKTLLSFVDELYRYVSIIFYIKEAVKTVLLWRGHYTINFCNCIKFKIPLHSIIAFGLGVTYTELPQYGLSVFFFIIAWFMLAMLEQRHKRPLPCDPPPTYKGLLLRFILGASRSVDIKPDEVSQEDIDDWVAKSKANEVEANRAFDAYMQNLEAEGNDEQEMKDLLTKRNNLTVSILKSLLHPYQLTLLDICYQLRFVKNILNWNHAYIAFWITSVSLALSVASIFLWEDIWLWVKRIFLYGLLGPWMKLLDWFYYQKLDKMTDEEKVARERKRLRRLRSWNEKDYKVSRDNVERNVKLAAMKKHMFGQVSNCGSCHFMVCPLQLILSLFSVHIGSSTIGQTGSLPKCSAGWIICCFNFGTISLHSSFHIRSKVCYQKGFNVLSGKMISSHPFYHPSFESLLGDMIPTVSNPSISFKSYYIIPL